MMKYRRRWLWPLFAFTLLLSSFYGLFVVCYVEWDHEGFRQVMEEVALSGSKVEGVTRQRRQSVYKDMWFKRGDKRLQMHLSSANSELVFDYSDGGAEVVEKMTDVICFIQEELLSDPDRQQIRYIEADNAVYHYQNDSLVAEGVKMVRYTTDGHTLVPSVEGIIPEMKGEASKVEIPFISKDSSFKADGEVAITYNNDLAVTADSGEYDMESRIFTLKSKERVCELRDNQQKFTLICPGEIIVDQDNMQAILIGKNEDQVYFFDAMGKVYADIATIDYQTTDNGMEPKKVLLEGNVRIINREGSLLQYVLSDKAIYEPESRKMHFESKKGKRVLFYDRANNLQVSAPALEIKRNEISNKNSIKGFGDVRFHLVEEELEQIRKRFLLAQDKL